MLNVHSTSARPAPVALVSALAVFLGTGAFVILGAQAQPDTPGPEVTGVAPVPPVADDEPDGATSDPTTQPIAFSHARHVVETGIDCQFCHAYARRGPVAGIPSVQRCAGCHEVVLSERPEIVRLLEYWENEEPIPWVRVHDLPDHVRFGHKPHIRAGVECAACHGNVAEMAAAVQVEPLSMGWCVSCHEDRGMTRNCLSCHY